MYYNDSDYERPVSRPWIYRSGRENIHKLVSLRNRRYLPFICGAYFWPLVSRAILPAPPQNWTGTMARYYLHLRDGTDVALDDEGVEYPDLAALREVVLRSARDCIAGDAIDKGVIDLRLRIDAENAAGEVVYSLPFADAVRVIPG